MNLVDLCVETFWDQTNVKAPWRVEVVLSLRSRVGSESLVPEGRIYQHLLCGFHVFKDLQDVFAFVKLPTFARASRLTWTGAATQVPFPVIVSELCPAQPPRLGQTIIKWFGDEERCLCVKSILFRKIFVPASAVPGAESLQFACWPHSPGFFIASRDSCAAQYPPGSPYLLPRALP